MQPYKLNVEINGSKFTGEGPGEDVRSDYAKFLEALKKHPQMLLTPTSRAEAISAMPRGSRHPVVTDAYSEVFRVDKENRAISLLLLPEDDAAPVRRMAKSMLLVLFGFKHFFGAEEVSVGDVSNALRNSGFTQFKRLDYVYRVLHLDGCATMTGTGRGTKYRVTASRGVTVASGLVQDLLKRVS